MKTGTHGTYESNPDEKEYRGTFLVDVDPETGLPIVSKEKHNDDFDVFDNEQLDIRKRDYGLERKIDQRAIPRCIYCGAKINELLIRCTNCNALQ